MVEATYVIFSVYNSIRFGENRAMQWPNETLESLSGWHTVQLNLNFVIVRRWPLRRNQILNGGSKDTQNAIESSAGSDEDSRFP